MATKREAIAAMALGRGCLGKAADDEVVFTLRSTDQCAPATIRYWAHNVEALGGDPRKVMAARREAQQMEAWQRANPDKVKVPD